MMDPIISVAMEAAGKAMKKEVEMLYGVKEQVEEMKMELQWMQSFLEDADYHISSQSQQRQSRVLSQWVFQVREASLDAEYIVDDYLVKLALRKRSGVVNLVKKYACFLKHGWEIHVVGSKIEALNSKLSRLRLRLKTYGAIRKLGVGDSGSGSTSRGKTKWLPKRSYEHIQDHSIVGLDEKVNEVVDLLLKGEEQQHKVVSIYGMSGLGKTTLAKKVYHDKRVRTHFDKFAWVYVSQQFKERELWESTLIELTSPSSWERREISELNDDELVAKLFLVEKDHKCVVVLDDICSIEDWEKLHVGFPREETGVSKILFTTRKKEVSEHANFYGSYGLECLKDRQAMKLLRNTVFDGRNHEIAGKEIHDLGRRMLKYCRGLPLAITVLGGILASKDSLSEWQTVHDNINAYFIRRGKGFDQEQGLNAYEGYNEEKYFAYLLDYSYQDLPSQLKICFLYLSIFPQGYEIETKKLMRMWMTEGFLSVEYDGEENETMEDLAERFLNELVSRRMVQVGKKDRTGRIKTCRLHMMRDVCLSKAKEENLVHNYNEGIIQTAIPEGKIRRLCFICDKTNSHAVSLSSYKRNYQVRSLILHHKGYSGRSMGLETVQLVDRFKVLKMLLLEGIDLGNMKGGSKGIGKLILLRYLSLRGSIIYGWPSLDNLGCMETLDLRVQYVENRKRPLKIGAIWKMKQLRHLYLTRYDDYWIGYSTSGHNMPIENLQTLVNFRPQPHGKAVIKFPNLRKLHIMQGKQGDGVDLSEILNHHTCFNLYKLKVEGPIPIEKFPQVNQFPTNLTKLVLIGSEISDPKHIETTLGNLPNLTTLKLGKAFMGEQLSFKKDTFPQLITLTLWLLYELKSWRVEQGAMPNLQLLQIWDVSKLEAIPEGLRFIATLNQLLIQHMPAEFAARLKEGGADFDIVKHVPSITFHDCRD